MFSLDESIYKDKKTTTKDDSFIDNYNEDSKIGLNRRGGL